MLLTQFLSFAILQTLFRRSGHHRCCRRAALCLCRQFLRQQRHCRQPRHQHGRRHHRPQRRRCRRPRRDARWQLPLCHRAEQDAVAIINTSTRAVVGVPIPVGSGPIQVASLPTANSLTSPIPNPTTSRSSTPLPNRGHHHPVGNKPSALAVTSDGSRVLVANNLTSNISVINTANNSVSATWTTLSGPAAIAIFGNNVYVANQFANSLSVHNLTTGAVLTSLSGIAPPTRWPCPPMAARSM